MAGQQNLLALFIFKLRTKKCDFFGRLAKNVGHFWMARFGQLFFFGPTFGHAYLSTFDKHPTPLSLLPPSIITIPSLSFFLFCPFLKQIYWSILGWVEGFLDLNVRAGLRRKRSEFSWRREYTYKNLKRIYYFHDATVQNS